MTHLEWLQTTATLDDYFFDVFFRLIDLTNLPEGEPVYALVEDDSLILYDRAQVNQALVKPSLESMQNDWAAYKAELITAEEARLAELARLEDLKSRWDAMTDMATPFIKVVPGVANMAVYFRDSIYKEQDKVLAESRLVAIEAEYASYSAQKGVVDLLQAAYDQLNAEVYAEMETTFGTKNADSATAYEKTWNIMTSAPSEWSILGLKDDLGNLLDTDQKILDYANQKLLAVEAYGKWRMQRIQQFRDYRASLGV